MNHGLLIVVDGIDGSGKTTFSKLAVEHLWGRFGGERVIHAVCPGSTKIGTQLRKLVKSREYDISPLTERMIFAADSAEFQASVVKPAIADNKILLCDRYSGLTDYFYGVPSGVSIGLMTQINALIQPRCPDLAIIFKCPWDIAKQRKAKASPVTKYTVTEDCRIEAKGETFMQAVAAGYNAVANKLVPSLKITSPLNQSNVAYNVCDRIHCIDASRDWADVKKDVFAVIDELLTEVKYT